MTPPFSLLGITVFERGWLSSNNILVQGRDHCALIDTGYATHARQTIGLVRSALGPRALDLVVNTHLHSDHCGGNAALRAAYPDLEIAIPPGQSEAVTSWDTAALTYEPTGQECPPFGFDRLLQPGQSVALGDHEWQIHAARGHDPHSVVLFEPTHRVVVSADALWQNGFGVVFPELDDDPGFGDVAQTLDLIESLEPAWVIPGHGAVFNDVAPALARARSRLQQFSMRPDKHRRHALKVLIKFKLLEWQEVSHRQLSDWFHSSSYFIRITRKDTDDELSFVLDGLIRELDAAGALIRDGEILRNR